jgi:hypothetical protein
LNDKFIKVRAGRTIQDGNDGYVNDGNGNNDDGCED